LSKKANNIFVLNRSFVSIGINKDCVWYFGFVKKGANCFLRFFFIILKFIRQSLAPLLSAHSQTNELKINSIKKQ